MQGMQALHRATIGRTRETRGPDALECGIAGLVVAAAIGIALAYGARFARMAQTLEAVALAAGPKIDTIVYHSVRGHWPSTRNTVTFTSGSTGLYVSRLVPGPGGVITAKLTLQPGDGFPAQRSHDARGVIHGALSFRPELLGSQDAPTVSFLCGYARPTTGAILVSGTNETSLPRKYLPPFCR